MTSTTPDYTPMTEEQDRELRRQFAEEQRRSIELLDDIIETIRERRGGDHR